MEEPEDDDDDEFLRLIFACPNCGCKCQFALAWHGAGSASLKSIHGHITAYVVRCTACQEFMFLRTRRVEAPFPRQSTIEATFPPAGIKPHQSLPQQVAVDMREASLCMSAGAFNAAAAMCRRAVQSCAKDSGADPRDDLFDQLLELHDKALIPATLYEMADAIRKKGNVGAHPGRDPVLNQNVSEREARSVFAIVTQVFKYIYEFPSEVAALRGS